MKTCIALIIVLVCFGGVAYAEESTAASALLSQSQSLSDSFGFGGDETEFLDPDAAFRVSLEVKDARTLVAHWEIADGYYLYRDKFKFTVQEPPPKLGDIKLPPGHAKEDPTFGQVEIYTGTLDIPIALERTSAGELPVTLTLGYQGCAEAGICYPPIEKSLAVSLPALSAESAPKALAAGTAASGPTVSEVDSIAERLANEPFLYTLLSFFFGGALLALTPCVLPMVPILSGIIVGRGHNVTVKNAFILSLTYVLAMAATYAVIGVVAALFGQNLQATFQNRWVLITFAALFTLLALSMFGFFKLQLPSSWQTRLTTASNEQPRGTLHGVAAMGALSAVIVGPCVAPPLAAALVYIGKSGDVVLGGLALFALGLGMGLPLLMIGTSAGKLVPKAGVWMEKVQAFFGVLLLGVAIWMLERVLDGEVTMLLWGVLLISSAIFMGATDPLDAVATGTQRFFKGLGIATLVYGVTLIVGAASGADDVFKPLAGLGAEAQEAPRQRLPYSVVKGVEGLEQALADARAAGKPVMLDFYADWCVECKQIEKKTLSHPDVRNALANLVLLQADVTDNDDTDQRLMRSLGLYGPPAALFYGRDAQERRGLRLVGFIGPDKFLEHIKAVLP